MSQSNEPGGQPESGPQSSQRPRGERETHPKWQARAERAEKTLERDAEKAWGAMKKRPSLGVLILGGLVVVAADAIGVGEVALGIAVGYVAYRALRKPEPARGAQQPESQQSPPEGERARAA
jgi:hypothetical protein